MLPFQQRILHRADCLRRVDADTALTTLPFANDDRTALPLSRLKRIIPHRLAAGLVAETRQRTVQHREIIPALSIKLGNPRPDRLGLMSVRSIHADHRKEPGFLFVPADDVVDPARKTAREMASNRIWRFSLIRGLDMRPQWSGSCFPVTATPQ